MANTENASAKRTPNDDMDPDKDTISYDCIVPLYSIKQETASTRSPLDSGKKKNKNTHQDQQQQSPTEGGTSGEHSQQQQQQQPESQQQQICTGQAFVVGCTQLDGYNGGNWKGCVLKIELNVDPISVGSYANSVPKITHRVCPGQGGCSDMARINDKLIVGSFDAGCIIPIKNFGPKKTFNCHVDGRITKHNNQIVRLTRNTKGDQIATASIDGFVSLYSVDGETITFITKISTSLSTITGLCYAQDPVSGNETLLLMTLLDGTICSIDLRSDQYMFNQQMSTFKSATAICSIPDSSSFVIGTNDGFVVNFDLRNMSTPSKIEKIHDNRVTRVKTLTNCYTSAMNLGICDLTDKLNMIDYNSFKSADQDWTCVKKDTGIVRDFTQIGDTIFTCGVNRSLGCWKNIEHKSQ